MRKSAVQFFFGKFLIKGYAKMKKVKCEKRFFDLYTQLNLDYPCVTHRVIHNGVNMPIRLIKKRIYETISNYFCTKFKVNDSDRF